MLGTMGRKEGWGKKREDIRPYACVLGVTNTIDAGVYECYVIDFLKTVTSLRLPLALTEYGKTNCQGVIRIPILWPPLH